MRVYIVRHGHTDACGGPKSENKDVPLSETGRRQIEKIRSLMPATLSAIYTSPTLRTTETAVIVRHTKNEIPIVPDIRLKNKDNRYELKLCAFLEDMRSRHHDEDDIAIVTHGRIVKMIYSIVSEGVIDFDLTDSLELDYGDVFLLDGGIMRWEPLKTDEVSK